MAAISARPTRPRVAGVTGAESTTTSLRPSNSISRSGGSTSSTAQPGPEGGGPSGRRRIPETRIPNGAAILATSVPMDPRPTMAMRRPWSVRMPPASSASLPHTCSACLRIDTCSCRASAMVTPSTCSAMARARTPFMFVSTMSLAASSGVSMNPTPAAGL